MFDVLVASGAHAGLKPQWLTTSVVTHALMLALALAATRAALDAPPVASPDEVMLLFVPKAPEPPPPPATKPQKSAPVVSLAAPPPQGFQTVAAPSDIPNVIPPIDLKQRALDPRDFTGRGVEGGVGDGVVGGTGPVVVDAVGLDAIYEATTDVPGFSPAVVLSQPTPQYPAALASVGVEGRISVEFVIDTTGKVEPASINIIERTHPAFESAARRAITGSIFRPARLSTVPVRQLTRQSVRFVAAH
jgi:TonB family protein